MQYFHISIPYDLLSIPWAGIRRTLPLQRLEKGGNPFENRRSNHLQPRTSASYIFAIYLQLGASKSFEAHFEGISTGLGLTTHCDSVSTSHHIDKKLEHRKFEVKFFDLDCYCNCLCLHYHSPVTNRRNSLSGIHARYQSTPPNSNSPQAMHIVHLSCHEPIAIIISQSTEKEEGEEKKEFPSSSSNLMLPSMHPIRSSKPPICNRDQ